MLFSPETIAEVKENQFAVVRDNTSPLQMKRLRRGIARYRATHLPPVAVAGTGYTDKVTQYIISIDSQKQERHLFHGAMVSWLHDVRDQVQASELNPGCRRWGHYDNESHPKLLINVFQPQGEFRWHRDIRSLVGVTVVFNAAGTADAYLAPASHPASSVPPRGEIQPIALAPGDVLVMDAEMQPWHRIVNTTPDMGERISLTAAQIRAEML